MYYNFKSRGLNVIKLDTSSGSIVKNIGYLFRRIKSIIIVALLLIKFKGDKNNNLYCSVSGNKGKIFEIFFVLIARTKKNEPFFPSSFIFIH